MVADEPAAGHLNHKVGRDHQPKIVGGQIEKCAGQRAGQSHGQNLPALDSGQPERCVGIGDPLHNHWDHADHRAPIEIAEPQRRRCAIERPVHFVVEGVTNSHYANAPGPVAWRDTARQPQHDQDAQHDQ